MNLLCCRSCHCQSRSQWNWRSRGCNQCTCWIIHIACRGINDSTAAARHHTHTQTHGPFCNEYSSKFASHSFEKATTETEGNLMCERVCERVVVFKLKRGKDRRAASKSVEIISSSFYYYIFSVVD